MIDQKHLNYANSPSEMRTKTWFSTLLNLKLTLINQFSEFLRHWKFDFEVPKFNLAEIFNFVPRCCNNGIKLQNWQQSLSGVPQKDNPVFIISIYSDILYVNLQYFNKNFIIGQPVTSLKPRNINPGAFLPPGSRRL